VLGPVEEFPERGVVFDFGGLLAELHSELFFDGVAELVSVVVVSWGGSFC
jgi:hypothetical protein